MGPQTFDATWAGERLGLSASTVLDMARRKDLPHVKVGRRVRFTEQNIEDYIAAHTIGAGMVRTGRSQAAHRRTV